MSSEQTLDWLSYVKSISTASRTIKFTMNGSSGSPIILEWKKTDIRSPDLAQFKKDISELAAQTLAPAEVDFLQAYPFAVSQELFLKSCAPLFEKGLDAVNWELAKQTVESTIRQFYLTDLSSFGEAILKPLLDDIYFLVMIKETDSDLLGFAMFAITPALPFGHVKLINIALTSKGKDQNLEQLLMSSIFKIIPRIEKLFLFVRPTNKAALKTYSDWGFTKALNPAQDPNHKINMDYLIFLEYRTEKSSSLQEIAETFLGQA